MWTTLLHISNVVWYVFLGAVLRTAVYMPFFLLRRSKMPFISNVNLQQIRIKTNFIRKYLVLVFKFFYSLCLLPAAYCLLLLFPLLPSSRTFSWLTSIWCMHGRVRSNYKYLSLLTYLLYHSHVIIVNYKHGEIEWSPPSPLTSILTIAHLLILCEISWKWEQISFWKHQMYVKGLVCFWFACSANKWCERVETEKKEKCP